MVQVTVFLCNYIITKSRMKYITISLQGKEKKPAPARRVFPFLYR